MDEVQSPLEEFYATLDRAAQLSWTTLEPQQQSLALSTVGQQLCQALQELGDRHAVVFGDNQPHGSAPELRDYLVFYSWMPAAKSFLLLWRDTIFEQLHAHLLALDGELDETTVERWEQDASTHLTAAVGDLKALLPGIEEEMDGDLRAADKAMGGWRHHALPWAVYREQIGTITTQIRDLAAKQDLLSQNSTQLQRIRQIIIDNLETGLEEIELMKKIAGESHDFIKEHAVEARNRIPVYLENQENQISRHKYGKRFNLALDKGLEQLAPETQVPVAVNGAALQIKDIDFRRYISRWLDSETLPLLYEVWELTTNIRNNLRMALINIRNRAILLNNEHSENPDGGLIGDDLCQPLVSFLSRTGELEKELKKLHLLVHERLDDNFRLSKVFDEDQFFLEVPLQSTINKFRSNQNELVIGLRRWWHRQRHRVRRWLSNVQAEDALSTSEKVVRYIEQHAPSDNNQAYTSIFLTKGYIGESFWVGRKNELQRIARLIQQWRNGFRGTVLLRGERFSGKSLFGDLVSNRHFPNDTIRLLPNSIINLQGRTFETSYDLGEALDFISKYRFDRPPLVWLDDLELWHDPASHTIHENARRLLHHMDHHSKSIFYLVAAGNPLVDLLEHHHEISRHIQATVRLDSMSQEDIQQAILIRHGATHKELVKPDGKALESGDFRKAAGRVYRASSGNIGEALNLWAYHTKRRNEEQVYQEQSSFYQLPNFITADHALILRTLLLEKRSNEYRLRKRFGPAFRPRYADALLRVLSVGIVIRHLDGWLEINDAAVNDVVRQLKNQQYL